VTKAGKVTKRAGAWYGVCNRCGDFVAAESQPVALGVLCEHLKFFDCHTKISERNDDPAALAALDRAKAGADATLNQVISQLRHKLAAGSDSTELWNDTFEEWRQHSGGSPMLAFAFATAVLRLVQG
jgi:hypothetical protein